MWWTVHLDGGPRRVNHAAVAVGDRIFSFGGYCTGDNYTDHKPIDVFVLNTQTLRWTEILIDPQTNEDWPFQRYGHTVVAFGESIFLFGGRNDEGASNILYEFNTVTSQWSRPAVSGNVPDARDGHTACLVGHHMYIFGGYEDTVERYGQDVYSLNLLTFAWALMSCQGEPPVHRDFHSSTVIGNKMFIFGGRSNLTGIGSQNNEYYSNKVCYLDLMTTTWYNPSVTGPRPKGRRSHSAIGLDDHHLLIFGGYNGKSREHKNDVWVLDTENWSWQEWWPNGTPPSPRRRQAMCRIGSKIYMFGGTSPYNGPPLYFTMEQLAWIPPADDEESPIRLMDHSDMYVLDLAPSLKTLCILVIKSLGLPTEGLPSTVSREIYYMSTGNKISRPLRTVESLSSG